MPDNKQKPLSPLYLKVLRLDHEGNSFGDIANTTKLSRDQVRKIVGSYRLRYFLSILGDKAQSFLGDIIERKPVTEIALRYNVKPTIVLHAFIKYKETQRVVMKRCNKCGGKFMTDDVKHGTCPECKKKEKK